ncbi:MAG: ATP phosphoribosyltransferase [Pseudomonadales bacterium]|jgi:ATP phosphoribosyltransferase|nr:ATP phosphoribosyltransferase [Pseudomonadales bacterium]MDP4641323.1 ATP phosphoribosyltransferase [Pseudomonadales bacterium]MDP4766321.1 ATP phosphoribosyltransferase [Pseudomonadales bacterium]MDP4876429.1 ATP phosphoribosyltransferase [Pseudomonadales bacterium]MDP4912442.1 ATP phosphoribosyltransferase [Pseudomonadales bacterium]
MPDHITIAVTKGDRIVAQQLALLAQLGIEPHDDLTKSRKLVFTTSREDVSLLLLRGSDVATYVEHGIADLGMAGKDVLLEHGEQGYYQPLDLKLGQCRIMVAGLQDEAPLPGRLKIATKFVRTAKQYYAERGIQVDIIKLYGAMELAPVTGLAHRIVDIVETGNTLKANGLVAMEHICDVSTRLIVNKTAMKIKYGIINALIEQLRQAVD